MEEFVQFRRDLHQHPETSGKQFETTQKIKGIAMRHGVREDSITMAPQTGLWIDLSGEAEPRGRETRIALRADIDALQMTEGNAQLEYRSVREGAAHMCGHDGHTATLAATIALFLAKAKEIPRNKHVRLIFQPAEEQACDKGALQMIKAGCLKGVDEIYGFHNHNLPFPLGHFSCKEGVIMSSISQIKIIIKGTGGHGSQPQGLKYALPKAIAFYTGLMKLQKQLKEKHRNVFTIMFPFFHSGERCNVISQTVHLEGTVRTFSSEIMKTVNQHIKNTLHSIEAEGFAVSLEIKQHTALVNHKKEIDNVIRLAQKLYGEEKVSPFGLPTKASEDFGSYLKVIPGAFFFVSGSDETHLGICHNPNYNFNDKLIPLVSNFWIALLEDRFAQ